MTKTTMFDTLLQLPLFQGLKRGDLTTILEKVRLHFHKFHKGDVIIETGTSCGDLMFLLNGEVETTRGVSCSPMRITECLDSPALLEPTALFGMSQTYLGEYVAISEAVHCVSVSKQYVLGELAKYEIFHMNMLNILCNRAQNLETRLWTMLHGSAAQRFSRFVRLHCETSHGPKHLYCSIDFLSEATGIGRTATSTMLKELQGKGFLTLSRGKISIPDLASLVMSCEEL